VGIFIFNTDPGNSERPAPDGMTRLWNECTGRALRGFTPCPDSTLRFLTRPMVINVGMLSKTSPDFGQGPIYSHGPEGLSN